MKSSKNINYARILLIIFFFVPGFVILPCIAFAEEFFEGILTFKMGANKGKSTDMKYFMKGSKMRMQIDLAPGMTSAGIADYDKKKIYMLMPQGNFYTEMDIDEKTVDYDKDDLVKSKITETDEVEDILGYKCNKLVSEKEGDITEIWIAKNFGKFYQPEFGKQNPTLVALQEKFESDKAFPFRIISYAPDKRELFRMEVSNVEKKDLDDSLFEVPAGYQKINPTVINPGIIKSGAAEAGKAKK